MTNAKNSYQRGQQTVADSALDYWQQQHFIWAQHRSLRRLMATLPINLRLKRRHRRSRQSTTRRQHDMTHKSTRTVTNLSAWEYQAIEQWAQAQGDKPEMPLAVRRLVALGLSAAGVIAPANMIKPQAEANSFPFSRCMSRRRQSSLARARFGQSQI